MATVFTSENFQAKVINQPGVVLVDFWAPWCPPCRALGPIIEQLASENQGRAVVGKLNVDENGEIAGYYGVSSIPAVLVFRDGELVKEIIGLNNKATYQKLIDSMVAVA